MESVDLIGRIGHIEMVSATDADSAIIALSFRAGYLDCVQNVSAVIRVRKKMIVKRRF